MANITLKVNGKAYAGWKTARVTRGIETISGAFELSVSDRWGGQENPWPILEEDECTIDIDGVVLITGYVDRRGLSYSAEEHSLTVAGRDKTGQLVDCSAVLGTWEFGNTAALTLAERICEPFGIEVSQQSGVRLPRPPAKFSVDPGDTAFDVIERSCRFQALLPVSDGAGKLLLMRPGSTRAKTELVQGKNILSASAEYDATSRFASYYVLGQQQGTDETSGENASAIQGFAEDSNVRRTARQLLVRAEGNVTPEHAKKRAEWEATVRAARSDAVTIKVQGWTQSDGTLWPVNALATVRSPFLGINGEMLIAQATYSVDEGGTTTELTLRRPDAFKPEPIVADSGEPGPGYWKEIEGGV